MLTTNDNNNQQCYRAESSNARESIYVQDEDEDPEFCYWDNNDI